MSEGLEEVTRAGLLRKARRRPRRAQRPRARRIKSAFFVTDGPFTEAKEVFGFERRKPERSILPPVEPSLLAEVLCRVPSWSFGSSLEPLSKQRDRK